MIVFRLVFKNKKRPSQTITIAHPTITRVRWSDQGYIERLYITYKDPQWRHVLYIAGRKIKGRGLLKAIHITHMD